MDRTGEIYPGKIANTAIRDATASWHLEDWHRYIPAHKTDIIFDWNGTLLDDVAYCVSIINDLLMQHAMPTVDLNSYRAKFGFPVIHYYEALGFDFKQLDFATLSTSFVTNYARQVACCKLFPAPVNC